MLKRILLFLLAIIIVSGCATKSQFIYNPPSAMLVPQQSTTVAVLAPLVDSRNGDKDIDSVYSGNPLEEIRTIIQKELLNTGLFKEIVFVSDAKEISKADMKIEPSLIRMEWEVPDYKALLGTAFATSFLTGGIGGVIYGSTKTDVYGNVVLHLKIVENSTGKILIDKNYEGHAEEKTIKFKCDTPETKARMVGNALSKAIETMTADLKANIGKTSEGNVNSSNDSETSIKQ